MLHNITFEQANEAFLDSYNNKRTGFVVIDDTGTVKFIQAESYGITFDEVVVSVVCARLTQPAFILDFILNENITTDQNGNWNTRLLGLTPKETSFMRNYRNLTGLSPDDLKKWIQPGDYRRVDSIIAVSPYIE